MQERWQMNKLGFVNFWLYDWEEFPFSEGRLLLRGENGAGKSVTTQSFIPFMLDGDLRPYRLDAFGSKDRKMAYYLLGEEKEESTGYLYLEFIKPERKLYRTLVVGLRARRSNSAVEFWGFCLSDGRRVGTGPEDFALFETKGSQRISLTRQEVHNRFGDSENWVERGSDYKQMVNRMLFGCAEMEQYDRLLRLLIQLRKPKLSKDFSPRLVQEILNASLQPLSEEDIAPMVNSMEKMDTIQHRLESLGQSLQEARQLRNEYTRYNQYVLGKKGQYYLTARQFTQQRQAAMQISCWVPRSPDALAVSVRRPPIHSGNASRSWCCGQVPPPVPRWGNGYVLLPDPAACGRPGRGRRRAFCAGTERPAAPPGAARRTSGTAAPFAGGPGASGRQPGAAGHEA